MRGNFMIFFRLKPRGIVNFVIMSKNNGRVYYAVGRGREIGIYDTWQECKSQIDGINQAKYRKFYSLEEAKEFVNFWKNYNLTTEKQPSESFVSKYSNYRERPSNRNLGQNCCWTIETNAKRMYSPPKIYKMKNYFALGCETTEKSKNCESNIFNEYKFPYVSPIKSFCKARLFRKSFSENNKAKQIDVIENSRPAHRKYSNKNFIENKSDNEVVVISHQKANTGLVDQSSPPNPAQSSCESSNNRSENVVDQNSSLNHVPKESENVSFVKPYTVENKKLMDNELSCTKPSHDENDCVCNKKILSQLTKQLYESIGLLSSITKYISNENVVSFESVEKSLKLWVENIKTNGNVNPQINSEEKSSCSKNSLIQQQNEESPEHTMQDISFTQLAQSSPVTDSYKSPSILHTTCESKVEEKNVDVLALNLRLDSFEKRFDACLKEIGAITSQLSQIKSEIKEIKEQVSSKATSPWKSSSPNKSKDLLQTTISFNKQNVESPKQSSLKRKHSNSDLRDAKRFSTDTDFFEYCNIKMEKVDYTSFTMDADDYVHVYTDGACHSNGKKEAKAGIGIWFGDCHPLNISEPVQGCATNNSAEIQAARIAITIASKSGIKKLKIFTDSDFLINCATKWIHRWKKNGWQLVKGGQVKNKAELEKLDEVASKLDVQWVKVEGHSGVYGNEMADRLANEGASKYKE